MNNLVFETNKAVFWFAFMSIDPRHAEMLATWVMPSHTILGDNRKMSEPV